MSIRPTIVCLCGSTRFGEAFRAANLKETLAGKIVLSIGCDMRSDTEIFGDMSPAELTAVKARLDMLHLRKIDLADEVLILNVEGYIGNSTRRELLYARMHGKIVRFLEPEREQIPFHRAIMEDAGTTLEQRAYWLGVTAEHYWQLVTQKDLENAQEKRP